jgi:hypothetical protein
VWGKLRGLAGIATFDGDAIFINDRPAAIVIHTIGMRFPVDIEIYDEYGNLVRKIENMKPWRLKFIWKKVKKVIERRGGERNAKEIVDTKSTA